MSNYARVDNVSARRRTANYQSHSRISRDRIDEASNVWNSGCSLVDTKRVLRNSIRSDGGDDSTGS